MNYIQNVIRYRCPICFCAATVIADRAACHWTWPPRARGRVTFWAVSLLFFLLRGQSLIQCGEAGITTGGFRA